MANVSNFSAATAGATVSGTLTDSQVVQPQVPAGLRADGPRVTFHFITEPWDSGNTYVYYDVVKDSSGASWICKYPQVPTGTPLEEGTYWTRWADPNAEVEELRGVVETYDSRIAESEKYESSTFICIGDSYTAQFKNWVTRAAKNCGCVNVINTGVGGTGYLIDSTTETGNTFSEQVDKAVTQAAAYGANSVKQIIVLGGFNDIAFTNNDANTIFGAIKNVYEKLINNFPNAKITFFPFQMVWDYVTKERLKKIVNIKTGMNYYGIPFDSHFTAECLCNIPLGTDRIHPIIEYGYWTLCSYVTSVLNGIPGNKSSNYTPIEITMGENVSGYYNIKEADGYVNVYAVLTIPNTFKTNEMLFKFNDAKFYFDDNNIILQCEASDILAHPLITVNESTVNLTFKEELTDTIVVILDSKLDLNCNG